MFFENGYDALLTISRSVFLQYDDITSLKQANVKSRSRMSPVLMHILICQPPESDTSSSA